MDIGRNLPVFYDGSGGSSITMAFHRTIDRIVFHLINKKINTYLFCNKKGAGMDPFFSFQTTGNDCLLVSIYHARSLVFDLNQVLFYFSQAVPGYIVWIHVECALESLHPVLKEHDVKCLFLLGDYLPHKTFACLFFNKP